MSDYLREGLVPSLSSPMDRILFPNLLRPSGGPCHPPPQLRLTSVRISVTTGISVTNPLMCRLEIKGGDPLLYDALVRQCLVNSEEGITPAVYLPSPSLLCHPLCPVHTV